jgi:hypothetical protein
VDSFGLQNVFLERLAGENGKSDDKKAGHEKAGDGHPGPIIVLLHQYPLV